MRRSSVEAFALQGVPIGPLSSSFVWCILRILEGNPKRQLLRGPWVGLKAFRVQALELRVPKV